MDQNTDIQHEVRRLRLLAASLELQHFTSTDTYILPILGGDRVIVIGTPAQVRAMLAADVDERCPHCDDTGNVHRPDGTWAGTCTCAAGAAPLTRCAAGRDGECGHAQCPQLRDGEPRATGRHFPLDSEGCHHD